MSVEGTGATSVITPAGANPDLKQDDPREKELGQAGTELLREMRTQLKEQGELIKTLTTRTQTEDDKAAKAEADRKAKEVSDAKAKEESELSAIEKLERRLEEEREGRLKTERRMQEREARDEFIQLATKANVRDDTAARDLYDLVKGDIQGDPGKITEILEGQVKARPHFFTEKRETQGHGGGEGTGGGGKGPKHTSLEAKFAAATGAPIEEYVKARDGE